MKSLSSLDGWLDRMEPALLLLNSSLHGDATGRAFLDRTTSIYVLDVTDKSKPQTYGCWNFIHQAMNEMERYEARNAVGGDGAKSMVTPSPTPTSLVPHARLLATMALRGARRSPNTDKSLVRECISNSITDHDNAQQQQREQQDQKDEEAVAVLLSKQAGWLVELNLELREIVMGRIAATAFDFNFHRLSNNTTAGPSSSVGGSTTALGGDVARSAFADPVSIDMFCAILSANAVVSGPSAINHFVAEWIIPSARTLPCFAVASVIRHLASEGMRKLAPAGTKDALQQLSAPVMFLVLVPLLNEAVAENSTGRANSSLTHAAERSRVAAMSLHAIKTWCDATDLSLPQIRHIVSKGEADIVSILSDAMYWDSKDVIDALAELIETTIQMNDDKVMSEGRMNQVRYIMQVDHETFNARFTSDQLKTIESKEMQFIVDELMSAVGLQRLRFAERQTRGHHDVCRNLARIAASLSSTWIDIREYRQPQIGVLGLLSKAVAHPHVHICALSVEVLTRAVPLLPTVAAELLPLLQRRAVAPHQSRGGLLNLDAPEVSGVSFDEFQNFRTNALADVLLACWRVDPGLYMDSCTSAVEEFCSGQAGLNVSLQLEAALFCIEQIATEALASNGSFPHNSQMMRLASALAAKPVVLMVNPLTRARLCRFIHSYLRWFIEAEGMVKVAADLAISAFILPAAVTTAPDPVFVPEEQRRLSLQAAEGAALTLKELLFGCPQHFSNENSISVLSAAWEASNNLSKPEQHDAITIDARVSLCSGICRVLNMQEADQRFKSLDSMAAEILRRLDLLSQAAWDSAKSNTLDPMLVKLGNEIRMLSIVFCASSEAQSSSPSASDCMENTSTNQHPAVPAAAIEVIHKAWPSVVRVVERYSDKETVAAALTSFLADLIPGTCLETSSQALLTELCSIPHAILADGRSKSVQLELIMTFLREYVQRLGGIVEKGALAALNGASVSGNEKEVGRLLEDLVMKTTAAAQASLGNAWARLGEEGKVGQTGTEGRPAKPTPKSDMESNESLAGMISLATACLDSCPIFLLHVPVSPDRNDDLLLTRAVDSAVASLNGSDPGLLVISTQFLRALIRAAATTQHSRLRSFVSECVPRVEGLAITNMLAGCCGRYELTTIGYVARLLVAFMDMALALTTTPILEAHMVESLRKDFFLLGDAAKDVLLRLFIRIAEARAKTKNNHEQGHSEHESLVTQFLEDIWELHQVENTNDLANSDSVTRFIASYRSVTCSITS